MVVLLLMVLLFLKVVLLGTGIGPFLVASLEVVERFGCKSFIASRFVAGKVRRPVVRELNVGRIAVGVVVVVVIMVVHMMAVVRVGTGSGWIRGWRIVRRRLTSPSITG